MFSWLPVIVVKDVSRLIMLGKKVFLVVNVWTRDNEEKAWRSSHENQSLMLLTFDTFWVFSFFDSSLATFCFLSLGIFTFGSFFVFCSLFSFFSEFSLSFITFSVVLNSSLSFLTSSGSSVSNYSFLTYELNCFFLNYSALASSPSVPSHLNPDFLPPLSVFSTSPRDLKTLTIS